MKNKQISKVGIVIYMYPLIYQLQQPSLDPARYRWIPLAIVEFGSLSLVPVVVGSRSPSLARFLRALAAVSALLLSLG